MKKSLLFVTAAFLLVSACRKDISVDTIDPGNTGRPGEDIVITGTDTLTYEVITADTGGWYGIWNDENNQLVSTGVDSITWGTANYFPSGWKYSFVPKTKGVNMLLSAAARSYQQDLTINFYRNGELVKTATNSSMLGVSKLLINSSDTLEGTPADPVVTYEVVLDNMDASKYEHDGWSGHWLTAATYPDDPLLTNFAIPSGWRYSFKPSLPFIMGMQGTPYSPGGAQVTLNFYVNGVLVQTKSAYGWIYNMTYLL